MLARRALSRLAVNHSSLLIRNASAISASRSLWRAHARALYASRSMATTVSANKPAAKKTTSATTAPKAAAKTKATAKKPGSTKAAAKKPAAKKPAAKKPAAKKPAAKKRVVKKVVPKKIVKKEPSQRQKKLLEKQKQRSTIQALRKTALEPPFKYRLLNGYLVFIMEHCSKSANTSQTPHDLVAASKMFRELTPSQVQHYKQIAADRNAATKIEYLKWIKSHSPEQIKAANIARRALRKKLKGVLKRAPVNTERLPDDRLPKSALHPFFYYIKERQSTGEFKDISVVEAAKLYGEEWRAMSPEQKKKYVAMNDAEKLAKAEA